MHVIYRERHKAKWRELIIVGNHGAPLLICFIKHIQECRGVEARLPLGIVRYGLDRYLFIFGNSVYGFDGITSRPSQEDIVCERSPPDDRFYPSSLELISMKSMLVLYIDRSNIFL